jgi:hypothetical protein
MTMRHASRFPPRRLGRTLLGTAALSAGLLAHALIAPDTRAALGGCRSDPIVLLSNGNALDLSAVVDDTYDDVQQVSYTLHAPVGTTMLSEVDTSILGPKDTFVFYADQPPNTYSAGTKVYTTTPQTPVAATAAVVHQSGTLLSSASASGQSPQTLWMDIALTNNSL